MDKKPLIGVSICAVVLLILASLTNVVGYQTFESSHQPVINNAVNPKELVFQTIVDIANNKEIQRIILKYQISRGEFPDTPIPVLTMKQVKQMYVVGVILSKTISKTKLHSMIQTHQLITPEIQQEINAVIQKDTTLNGKITQLSTSECGCENENTTSDISQNFICDIFLPLAIVFYWFVFVAGYTPPFLFLLLDTIDKQFDCTWGWNP